jgi:hypothetical protein
MPDFDDKNQRRDGRDEYPFEAPPKVDLSELTIPADVQEASDLIKVPIEDVFAHPERYSFEKLAALTKYLAGEKNRASLSRLGGAVKHEYLFRENPEVVTSEPVLVRQVWRFSAYRLAGDEKTILAASFDPKLVQLDDGARVTEEVLQVPIIDPACPVDSRFHSLPLSRWPLRIPPSQSLVVDGDALRDRFIQFSDADKIGRAWFPELDFVKLGTNKSLGLLGFPGSIKMVNHARRDEVTMGEDFKQTFLGVWNDEIFGKRDGSHLKLTFTREGGALSKRFVTITNKGDIAIALKFTPRSGIEEDS